MGTYFSIEGSVRLPDHESSVDHSLEDLVEAVADLLAAFDGELGEAAAGPPGTIRFSAYGKIYDADQLIRVVSARHPKLLFVVYSECMDDNSVLLYYGHRGIVVEHSPTITWPPFMLQNHIVSQRLAEAEAAAEGRDAQQTEREYF